MRLPLPTLYVFVRIVIALASPSGKTIALAHEPHPGFVWTKHLCELYWWTEELSQEEQKNSRVENAVKNCDTCQIADRLAHLSISPPQARRCSDFFDGPQKKLAIDIAGPIEHPPTNCRFSPRLITSVSHFSAQVPTSTLTSFLLAVPSREGYLEKVVSDNGLKGRQLKTSVLNNRSCSITLFTQPSAVYEVKYSRTALEKKSKNFTKRLQRNNRIARNMETTNEELQQYHYPLDNFFRCRNLDMWLQRFAPPWRVAQRWRQNSQLLHDRKVGNLVRLAGVPNQQSAKPKPIVGPSLAALDPMLQQRLAREHLQFTSSGMFPSPSCPGHSFWRP